MAASLTSQNAAISTPGMKARRFRAYVPREPTPTTPTRTRASGGATKLLIAPAPPIFGRALAHPPAARAIAASPAFARKSLLHCPLDSVVISVFLSLSLSVAGLIIPKKRLLEGIPSKKGWEGERTKDRGQKTKDRWR